MKINFVRTLNISGLISEIQTFLNIPPVLAISRTISMYVLYNAMFKIKPQYVLLYIFIWWTIPVNNGNGRCLLIRKHSSFIDWAVSTALVWNLEKSLP